MPNSATDERIRILVLLAIPSCEEDVLKSLLSRANVRVEAWAQDVASTSGVSSEAVREMIFSTTVPLTDEPFVLAREADDSHRTSLLLAWSAELTLARPRVRMLDPAAAFFSVLTVTSPDAELKEERLLAPFEAVEKNVFSTLRLPSNDYTAPYFPASALTKIIPEQRPAPHQHRVEHMSTRVRLVPSVITRMTYHRSGPHNGSPSIIAALNVEVIPFIELKGDIRTLQVSIAHGTVDDLTQDLVPMSCRSKDLISFLYRLQQTRKPITGMGETGASSQLPNFDVLTIHMELDVSLSDMCKPQIVMDLTTNIDFFQALNPSYGGPAQPMQRPHRPASLPLSNYGSQSQVDLSTTLQPALNLATFQGVSISFTAPTDPVKVGKPFIWRILVNNHSSRAAKLAVYPLPRVARNSYQGLPSAKQRHVSRMSLTSSRSHDHKQRAQQPGDSAESEIAQAVVDENVIYALQHSHALPRQTDILALTAEVRIGSLGPGQCHEGEIEFLALKAGTFQIDMIRIVDVIREAEEGISSPGVMLDIRDLPDIVAEL